MQCISSTTVGKKIRRQIFYSPCRRWDIRSPPVCMSFPITFLTASKSDIRDQLQAQTYDAVFTFNFFPLVSDMAESLHIPYICWVFDCPHYTLYSNSIRNSCNYLFLFDRDMCQSAIRRGARHAFHLPLAINTARLKEQLGISSEGGLLRPDTYMHDISFVGSLYESSHYSSFRYAPNHLARLSGRHHCCPEGSVGNRPHLAGSYSRTARGIHRFHALFRCGI